MAETVTRIVEVSCPAWPLAGMSGGIDGQHSRRSRSRIPEFPPGPLASVINPIGSKVLGFCEKCSYVIQSTQFAEDLGRVSQFSDQPGACFIALDDVEYTLYSELSMPLTVWYRINKGSTRRCI